MHAYALADAPYHDMHAANYWTRLKGLWVASIASPFLMQGSVILLLTPYGAGRTGYK